MTRAKLFAKMTAIQTMAAELNATLAAMPADVSEYAVEDMAAELTEVLAILRKVKRDAKEETEVYA